MLHFKALPGVSLGRREVKKKAAISAHYGEVCEVAGPSGPSKSSSKTHREFDFPLHFSSPSHATSRSAADFAGAWVGAASGSARRDIPDRLTSGGTDLTGSLTSSGATTWPRPHGAGRVTGCCCSSGARTPVLPCNRVCGTRKSTLSRSLEGMEPLLPKNIFSEK